MTVVAVNTCLIVKDRKIECHSYASATKHLGIGVLDGLSVGFNTTFKKVPTHTRRRETSYDVATLLLMVTIEH